MPPIVGVQLREPLAAATGVPGLSTWRTHRVFAPTFANAHYIAIVLSSTASISDEYADVVSPVERAISLFFLLIYFSFARATAESRCFNATDRMNEIPKVPRLESQKFARFIIAEMSLKSPDVTDLCARLRRNCA